MADPCIERVAVGKLHPAAWNPREISKASFASLKESIKQRPEFLGKRPILAMADGTIYAGNMRYRAAVELGMTAIPAIVEDVPEDVAKELALIDNNSWGSYDDDLLAEMVAQMKAAGSRLDTLGFDQKYLDELLSSVGVGTRMGEIVISPEKLERQDYVVFVFDNELDWRAICERFGVGTVYEQDPTEVRAGAQSANTGVGRVLRGAALLKLLDGGTLGDHEAYVDVE